MGSGGGGSGAFRRRLRTVGIVVSIKRLDRLRGTAAGLVGEKFLLFVVAYPVDFLDLVVGRLLKLRLRAVQLVL